MICDSYVRPSTLVRICDECNYGSYQGRCVICGGPGVSDAYYCKECTIMEKDVSICQERVDGGGGLQLSEIKFMLMLGHILTRAPDKERKTNFNRLYLCYFFTKSYV